MKQLFFVALFVLLGAFVTGCNTSGVNTKGIPDNSLGVAYVKLQDGGKSNILQFFRDSLEKEDRGLKEDIGIHLLRDVSEITAGFLPFENDQGVIVLFLRGNLSEADYNAKTENFGTKTTIGKYVFRNHPDSLITLLDKDTFLCLADLGNDRGGRDIRRTAAATAAIAAYEGKAKSCELPQKLLELSKNTQNPIFLVAGESRKYVSTVVKQTSLRLSLPTLPESSYVALGDDGKAAKLFLRGDFKEQSDALKFQAFAQMGLGGAQSQIGQIFRGKEKSSLSESARKILSSVKYESKDGVFTLSADSDSGELLNLLKVNLLMGVK